MISLGSYAGRFSGSNDTFAINLILILSLIVALAAALIVSKYNHIIGHYTLRFLLTRSNILPHGVYDWQLIYYLDTMHERILLRRVGGGWKFIHRYLQDYFGSLTTKEIAEIAQEVE